MQFLMNGPNIPDQLLQEHEDGNVVFFCGAGISMPAGLPSFKELVNKILKNLNYQKSAVLQKAIKSKQYDQVLNLLEQEIEGGRKEGLVRQELLEILKPDYSKPKAKATHQALLTLGKTREGLVHLISTNFDRIFEDIIDEKNLSVRRFKAPLFPIPKKNWNGLVYLGFP